MLLVWFLVGAVAGVLMLAAVPVELAFRVEHHDGRGKAGGTLCWLFGAARIPLGKGKGKGKDRKRVRSARKHTVRRQRGKRRAAGRLTAMLELEGFLWRLLRLVRDLLRRIHIRELSVQARVGLDDPADTGRLWALVGPLAGIMAMLPIANIAVEPQFTSAVFDIDIQSRVRLIPLRLLLTVLIFALSPGTLRALRAVRAAAR